MKKLFLCLTVLAFCAAFSGCKKNTEDTVKSIWESRTEVGVFTLQFIDENTCSITTSSGKPGVYDVNCEFFNYSPWYGGPKQVSLYSLDDTEKRWEDTRYIARHSDDTHLILVPLLDGVEIQSDALVLTRKR